MPTKGMPLQFFELGMVLSVVHNGSWMNMISKLWLTSRIVLIRKLFFQTFWENIFKFFKIVRNVSWYTWTLIFYFDFILFLSIFFDFIFIFILFYFLTTKRHMIIIIWCITLHYVIGSGLGKRGWKDNVKVYVYSMFIL